MSSKAIFFWRETEVPFGYLSQWYSCKFTVDGVDYATSEMWMMVQKARLFGDAGIEKQMLATTDPKKHRSLGRKVKNYDGEMWDKHKFRLVEEGNYHKFTKTKQSAQLKDKLLATAERELVEASPFDRIWGVGFRAKTAELNRDKWGENLLGKALMKVRARLRGQEDEEEEEEDENKDEEDKEDKNDE